MQWKTYLVASLVALTLPLAAAHAAVFPMPEPGNDIVGKSFTIQARSGDSLFSIGEDYGIGYHEMLEANPGVSAQSLSSGTPIVVPAAFILPKYREGIVINIAEVRLYYFTEDGKYVYTYPVGLGRKDWRTPIADTTVVRKKKDPTWYVPKSIHNYVQDKTGKVLPKFIPPGPKNPLGPYAIYLQKSGYLIHGTNQPWSIGKLISAGCIRMHNEDVTELFPMVSLGTKVRIVHHPYKVGWLNNVMYMEAHEPVALEDPINRLNILDADSMIQTALKSRHANVEWNQVDRAIRDQRGMPYAIGNFHQFSESSY